MTLSLHPFRWFATAGGFLLVLALGACAVATESGSNPGSMTYASTTSVPATTESATTAPDEMFAPPTSAGDNISTPTTTSAPTTTSPSTSAAEVYQRVSPSIAFVDTPKGSGSGILIEGGYVVTNQHVVWPHRSVRVLFPEGPDLQEVPVVAWDFLRDLAVLGPVEVSAQALKLADGEGLTVGDKLLMLGYPVAVESTPQPTITAGVLSRFRQWEGGGITLFQTDATIEGGQSGGALLDGEGRVIGITTLSTSEGGLALSVADIAPVVEDLIAGGYDFDEQLLPVESGGTQFDVGVRNLWDVRPFVVDATAGTELKVELEGPATGRITVSGPSGLLVDSNQTDTRIEEVTLQLPVEGTYFVQVGVGSGGASDFALRSNVSLIPAVDFDDGRSIGMGETTTGKLDFPGDADWYRIDLQEGEKVKISTDSITVETAVYVYHAETRDNKFELDVGSGGGLFDQNAELVFQAPNTGEFFIAVTDVWSTEIGGYYLSVENVPVST